MATHVVVANTANANKNVPAAQLIAAANDAITYVKVRRADGTMQKAHTKVITAIGNGTWSATTPLNAAIPAWVTSAFGNTVPKEIIQSVLNRTTSMAYRDTTLAAFMNQADLGDVVIGAAQILLQYANAEAHRIPGQALLLPVTIPPGYARVVFDTLMLAGTILLITDPIGWIVLIGGYVGNEYMNANSM